MTTNNTDEKKTEEQSEKKPEDRSLSERDRDYVKVYRRTRDHRAAVRAYCAGNVWATENAKAVGNW